MTIEHNGYGRRQAFFPSSACAATPERMAISLLCALINLITKQETSIKNYSASLESLNFTNNSENMYRGGGTRRNLLQII